MILTASGCTLGVVHLVSVAQIRDNYPPPVSFFSGLARWVLRLAYMLKAAPWVALQLREKTEEAVSLLCLE